ncbi:MAG: hypothetical protein Q8L45_00925 [Xanthomonadaceae bacterium]|nr:hypothetical protein [Xanthomonadaceae bacterium]MDP2184872.1 hypothetical protein [Xanthomonadales bacterium]MDZ4116084.1 hypothetical protein [Xanthomonadaceae bacterium]MDZ4377138.1 hypothetical protein [Xanthomonadaceae bacterium]
MKIFRVLIPAGAALGLLLWFWQGSNHSSLPAVAPASLESLQVKPAPAANRGQSAANPPLATGVASAVRTTATVPASSPLPVQIFSAEEIKAMDPSLVALSPEEASWLYKHGYPTQAELDALATTSYAELEQRTRSGDQRAITLLGLKHEMDGNLERAEGIQAIAAQKGSLFAREKMAELSLRATESNPTEDPTLFYLYMQIAKVFGDHRADAIISNTLPRNMNSALREQMERSALASLPIQLQLIAEDARLRGVPQPAPERRPNAELWNQIDESTLTQAPVYSPAPPGGP